MKHEFKPFDRVLVRDANDDVWRIQFYSHPYEDFHACLNGVHWQCVPYEGNENLLGTTDSPESEFKNGDIVAVWDKNDTNKMIRVYSHYDSKEGKHVAYMMRDTFVKWDYAEKFVPATVES
jgi:hypothetical protein